MTRMQSFPPFSENPVDSYSFLATSISFTRAFPWKIQARGQDADVVVIVAVGAYAVRRCRVSRISIFESCTPRSVLYRGRVIHLLRRARYQSGERTRFV